MGFCGCADEPVSFITTLNFLSSGIPNLKTFIEACYDIVVLVLCDVP